MSQNQQIRPSLCIKFAPYQRPTTMNKSYLFSSSLLLACITLLCSVAQAQEWEEVEAPPFYRHHSNGFTYNDADEWSQIGSFPGPARAIAIGDEWDGKYYYGFGRTASQVLNDLWVFDPADSSFTELATCPCRGRTHPALAAYKGKIFMGTGSSTIGDLDDWWIYDIATDTWEQKQDLPGGNRHHPFFFTDADDVYVGGGHRTSWYKWNITDETWTIIDGEPSGRVAGTQFQHNGYGYVLAGDDRFHELLPNDEYFMRYDPATDEWEKLPSIPNDRWAPSSFIVDDYIYLFGGLSTEVRGNNSMIRFDLSSLDESSSTTDIQANELQLFPNPSATGSFNVNFTTTNLADWDVQFFDITGRNVTDLFAGGNNGVFTTASKGTFIFSASHTDGRTARRLVILE